jgi:hypothetical protein
MRIPKKNPNRINISLPMTLSHLIIPLYPPLEKRDILLPLIKGGQEGFLYRIT